MILIPVGATLFAAFMGAVAQIFFKKAASKPKLSKEFVLRAGPATGLYGLGTILFIFSVKYSSLVLLYPLLSTGYFWTGILGQYYLKEPMNSQKWLGVVLIIMGTFLVFQ